MISRLVFPFSKRKTAHKLEDTLPILPPSNRPSAWSYSYDLKVDQISQEALKKTIQSSCLETEVEDESSYKGDIYNDFIFGGSKQIHELAAIGRLRESLIEATSYNSLENILLEHSICSPGDCLESETVKETYQSVDNVKRLRLSDEQKNVWSFSKEMGNSNETKPKNKENIPP